MNILAIDPGNVESAYVVMDSETYKPVRFEKMYNEDILERMNTDPVFDYTYHLAIEMIASYGMAVGKEVFDTCVWIGRFIECFIEYDDSTHIYTPVYRKDVKIHLCGTTKAKDANIRQALIDRFGVVGTKKNPGWFYGFKADMWSAYAVGVTYLDKKKEQSKCLQ